MKLTMYITEKQKQPFPSFKQLTGERIEAAATRLNPWVVRWEYVGPRVLIEKYVELAKVNHVRYATWSTYHDRTYRAGAYSVGGGPVG